MFRFTLPLLTFCVATTANAQILLVPDATSDQLVAFDPFDGHLLNPAVFAIPNTVQVGVIDVNGEIWLTEQTGDRITRRDLSGAIIGTIGPTFPGGGFDNIRGLANVGGLIYVTNAGSANGATANSVVILDSTGAHVSTFSVNTLATSPFAVLGFQGDILVSGFSNANDVYRFTVTGTPVGVFHNSTTISPAHGLALAGDGNVWCVGFTSANVCKLDATTGAVLTSFPAPSTPRGVYELGNGNVMWTNGTGVHIFDVVSSTSTQVFVGACYHVGLFSATPASTTVFGTGCDGLTIGTNGLPQLGNASFEILLNNVPAISPIGLFAFGSQALNPGIDLTVIGMPGCFGHTNQDIGLFSGSPVVAGTSTFALPVPNVLSLSGASLSSQGVSFSLATSLGLATSDGVTLVVGK